MVTMLAPITKLVSICVRGINEQLPKTLGADVLSSMRILRKTHKEVAPLPRLVRPRDKTFILDCVSILLGENCWWSLVGLKGAMLRGYCCFGVNSVLAPSPPSLFLIWLPG